ncbi:MAG: sensor histidine kinase, partial [Candidatus Cloacimonetes bacterium]|nr:sensor histidine kinase [Candidatus Cloacimonadota bacterium]
RRFKQILVNLVNNAFKFTEKGWVEVKAIEKGKNIEVIVKDTGIGIKKEHMERLFKAFSQIPTENRLVQEGTGLGLYLSQKIANLLGGKINVESEFGKGSKFTLSLPLKFKEIRT